MKKWKKNLIVISLIFLPRLVFAQWNIDDLTEFELPDATLGEIIEKIATWLLIIIGTIAVIGFLIAGILYLTAAGDEDRIKTAKRAMLYSIIGIIVALAGGVAVNVAMNLWSNNTNDI